MQGRSYVWPRLSEFSDAALKFSVFALSSSIVFTERWFNPLFKKTVNSLRQSEHQPA